MDALRSVADADHSPVPRSLGRSPHPRQRPARASAVQRRDPSWSRPPRSEALSSSWTGVASALGTRPRPASGARRVRRRAGGSGGETANSPPGACVIHAFRMPSTLSASPALAAPPSGAGPAGEAPETSDRPAATSSRNEGKSLASRGYPRDAGRRRDQDQKAALRGVSCKRVRPPKRNVVVVVAIVVVIVLALTLRRNTGSRKLDRRRAEAGELRAGGSASDRHRRTAGSSRRAGGGGRATRARSCRGRATPGRCCRPGRPGRSNHRPTPPTSSVSAAPARQALRAASRARPAVPERGSRDRASPGGPVVADRLLRAGSRERAERRSAGQRTGTHCGGLSRLATPAAGLCGCKGKVDPVAVKTSTPRRLRIGARLGGHVGRVDGYVNAATVADRCRPLSGVIINLDADRIRGQPDLGASEAPRP